jgi:hypothetical protein
MLRLFVTVSVGMVLCAPAVARDVARDLAKDNAATYEISAQRRTQLVVTPGYRRLSASATRECTAWLEREIRPSGPVVVPRQRCWWR